MRTANHRNFPSKSKQWALTEHLSSRAKQGFDQRARAFGGTLLKGNNAKRARPLDSKLPIHLVLRSSIATGEKSLRRGQRMENVRKIVEKTAKKYGVSILEYANAGNHLHILLKLHKRFLWKAFICELTGRIANLVVGYSKLRTQRRSEAASQKNKKQKFWDYRPFTRVVQGWGRSYRLAKDYVALNAMEAVGLVSRQDLNWREIFARGSNTA